jgi:hypothetical protein
MDQMTMPWNAFCHLSLMIGSLIMYQQSCPLVSCMVRENEHKLQSTQEDRTLALGIHVGHGQAIEDGNQ